MLIAAFPVGGCTSVPLLNMFLVLAGSDQISPDTTTPELYYPRALSHDFCEMQTCGTPLGGCFNLLSNYKQDI